MGDGRIQKPLRTRIADYALGMLHETAWILALTALAYLVAVLAVAVYR